MARARPSPASTKATDSGSAAKLARLGLATDWDLLLHLPLRYVDETRVTPIAELAGGEEAQVEGDIVASEISYRGRRQLTARLADETGEVLLRFLHFYPSQAKSLAVGRRVRALGAVRGGTLGLEMVHPRVRAAAEALPTRLTPVYPAGAGISQQWLRTRIEHALRAVALTDTLPEALRVHFALAPLESTLRDLHQPPAGADEMQLTARQEPLWRRIRFDELLAQQLTLRSMRARRSARAAPPLIASGDIQGRLRAALPFALTGAQQRVWREIERDLESGVPMHRLVQGDVGSGKTVVAALAAARAIDAGYQAALMAPTEILAEQHFGRIEQWLAPLGVHVAWLTGRLTAAEKRAAHAGIAQGAAQLVVGTHALVQDKVKFAHLGLAIVDEQHRFGVAQRLALRDAAVAPHLLMLSATPIPRTLAMSYLADVDVSVLDEMPPGRQPVMTKLVSTARREEVLTRIRSEVRSGRQVYWVCPLVDESEKLEPGVELTAATTMYEQTRALLSDLRLGLLHGQLPAAEKGAVMQAFAAGMIDVLVATTVVEVGVDVANASLMVIDHAQRFGLAQLHQLRGRVGRGAIRSYCVLLFDEPLSEAARERLKVIFETTDGFEVARRDLQLRGPGEVLGARQAGVPLLRFADLERDAALLEIARDAATVLLEQYPALAAEHTRRWLGTKAALLDA
ncbi:MAG TPA: ATP-dependent DNA helicase RecG [Burkholderiaceae bacterium]|nr:ATP-dependent DNA helicase RecG [Burkholderiaceae bacterium]